MRIALIIDNLAGGGAEKAIIKIAQALRTQGADAHILLLEDRREHRVPDDVPVHSALSKVKLSSSWQGKHIAAFALRRLYARLERDGAFDLAITTLTITDEVARLARIPRLWHRIANTLSMPISYLAKYNPAKAERRIGRFHKVYGNANLIAVSNGVAQDLCETLLIDARCIEIIPNPFDLEAIRAAAQAPAALPTEPYLVHVGRTHPQKRHDLLLDAFQALDFDGKLVLLTKPSLALASMIHARGLEKRVLLPGFQQDPYPWIANARLLVLSSDWEGLPNVLIEALALGTPAVSTDCPSGPAEILRGKLSDFLVPTGDAAALADAMRRALVHYPAIPGSLFDPFLPAAVSQSYLDLAASPPSFAAREKRATLL
jgi:glycosyltransferase involved in cell wall biosynthesis